MFTLFISRAFKRLIFKITLIAALIAIIAVIKN